MRAWEFSATRRSMQHRLFCIPQTCAKTRKIPGKSHTKFANVTVVTVTWYVFSATHVFSRILAESVERVNTLAQRAVLVINLAMSNCGVGQINYRHGKIYLRTKSKREVYLPRVVSMG